MMVFQISFILVMALFTGPAVAAGPICPDTGPLLPKDFLELRRQVDNIGLKDVRAYCGYQMTERFVHSRKDMENVDPSSYYAGKSSLEDVIQKSKFKIFLLGPKYPAGFDTWEISALPAPNLRINAALAQLGAGSDASASLLPPSEEKLKTLDSVKEYFSKCAAGKGCRTERLDPSETRYVKLSEIGDHSDADGRIKDSLSDASSGAALAKACSELTVLSALGCKDSVVSDVKFVAPDKTGRFSAGSLYKKMFSDGRYARGLSTFATKLIDRERESRTKSPDSNAFDDLKASFKESGESDKSAEEMAWNTMGLWSTAGANLNVRLDLLKASPDANASIEAMNVMSALLPVLDGRSSSHVYSFPKEVNNTCDNGKAYHFWMSAFLAQKNVHDGQSPIAAASASVVVQKGYQIMGRSNGETARRSDAVLKYDSFNPVQNVVRLDLNYSEAGAVYGAAAAGGGPKTIIDMDQGLRQMHEDGSTSLGHAPPSQGFMGNISAYNDWSSVFNPNPQFQRYYDSSGL